MLSQRPAVPFRPDHGHTTSILPLIRPTAPLVLLTVQSIWFGMEVSTGLLLDHITTTLVVRVTTRKRLLKHLRRLLLLLAMRVINFMAITILLLYVINFILFIIFLIVFILITQIKRILFL